MQSWNYDKPHRCPECHAIWVYGPDYSPGQESITPRWWRTYRCYRCGTQFTGRWAWRYSVADWLRMQAYRLKRGKR